MTGVKVVGLPCGGWGFLVGVCEDVEVFMDFASGCYLGVEDPDLLRGAYGMCFCCEPVTHGDFFTGEGVIIVGVKFWGQVV
jgi:hypothetical protein